MTKENPPLDQFIFGAGIALIAIVALYATMMFIFSYSSGWQRLREIYGVGRTDTIESWPFQSASFHAPYSLGILGIYRQCLSFGYSENGIYISGMFPFIWFHKPILIPWKDVVVTVIDDYSLSFLSVPAVSISISKKVYDGLIASKRVENTDSLGIR